MHNSNILSTPHTWVEACRSSLTPSTFMSGLLSFCYTPCALLNSFQQISYTLSKYYVLTIHLLLHFLHTQAHMTRLTVYSHHLGGHTMGGWFQQVPPTHQMLRHQIMEHTQKSHWGSEGVLYDLPKKLRPYGLNYFASERKSCSSCSPSQSTP